MEQSICGKYLLAKLERDEIIKNMVIGFVVGAALGTYMLTMASIESIGEKVSIILMFGFVLSGTPYMWSKLPKLYGFGIVSLILLIVKLSIAMMVGFIFTPCALIIKFIQTKIYLKQVSQDKMIHPEKYVSL